MSGAPTSFASGTCRVIVMRVAETGREAFESAGASDATLKGSFQQSTNPGCPRGFLLISRGIQNTSLITCMDDRVRVAYTTRDLSLYAVGIGAPGCKSELKYVYERHPDFAAFPTYPLVLGFKGASSDVVGFPSPAMRSVSSFGRLQPKGPMLDGERHIVLHRPLPPGGSALFLRSSVLGVHPKRSGTVLETESELMGAGGEKYATIRTASFYVGVKDAKQVGTSNAKRISIPSRAPDKVVEQKTAANQAEIYRLSGDYNPLHVDPVVAKAFGFKSPILHGLCTMGHSARHVVSSYGGGDPASLRSIRVRFSSPVFPGETLVTQMWELSSGRVVFRTLVKERKKIVMKNCEAIFGTPSSKL